MKESFQLATPPPKPLLIFDGDCHFCTLWIKRWRQITGEAVEYLPLQDPGIAQRFPELSRAQLETAVHLIGPGGSVHSGAEAVFRTLACNPRRQTFLHWYRESASFAALTEWGYRFVAEHRPLFSWLTRMGWGRHVERPEHFLTRWIFLRALGIIYLVAFTSLWTQISGLVGHNGILPAQETMSMLDQPTSGWERYWTTPTLCWFTASDSFLHFQCAAGTFLAVLLVVGIAPAPCLFLLWVIYLSLCTVCRDFLGFQWDNLLLETGFLAIFLAPLQFLPRPSREAPPSRLVLWLLRWLLFRLMFESGCVKLLSGDLLWRHLTALTVHYETQPLPTWIGWWAHQLPRWFQQTSCVIMFAVELVLPFFFLASRRLRIVAAIITAVFEFIILLTGNYTFFNWLAIALCILLLDDFVLKWKAPAAIRNRFAHHAPRTAFKVWPRFITVPLAAIMLSVSLLELTAMFRVRTPLMTPAIALYEWVAPFRSLNRYGLFAVMTNPRLEIVVEGSDDREHWEPYEFKYKPGSLDRRPGFVAPHQPRLDWQMWFAALGEYRQNPWFINFCIRLLQGSPDVLALVEKNPFPGQPPKYIRAELFEYHFTDPAERKRTGAWWRRELKGDYLPIISLRAVENPAN